VARRLCVTISNHFDSIAVTGTTGEFNMMTVAERIKMYKVVKEAVAGRVPLVADTGAASVQDAVTLSQEAEKIG
jgi:4-hydroxy-tetrahydrodipicolinate synthase